MSDLAGQESIFAGMRLMLDIHNLALPGQGRVTADVGYLKFYLPLVYSHKNTLV